ncbi:MAG: hypothetical protein QOJ65_2719 [Fimbriimonadaceae bacterium]|jgi:hypothetical protein|nr:hypothetical protein [Fimbriimonadaceae bacterium]
MKLRRSWPGILPALVVAALVLFVFATLQNYGPESAVRRFHEAVLTQNEQELRDVIMEPTKRDPSYINDLYALEERIADLMMQGARVTFRSVDRRPTQVWVSVNYKLPDNTAGSAPWVVQKVGGRWKVDVHATYHLPN